MGLFEKLHARREKHQPEKKDSEILRRSVNWGEDG